MFRHVIRATVALAFHFFILSPVSVDAQSSPVTDVNVKNFPETQQIKGDVQISNFPEVQNIKGTVSLDGMTKFITKENVLVPTSQRAELSEMIYAGTVETEGYTSVLISMQGEIRSDAFSSGSIGVLLVPDEKPVLKVLRDVKRVQFPIECRVQAKSGDAVYFEFQQVPQRIAFARYKMYLYNTTNKSAETNVYIYLSHFPPGSGE